MELRCENGIKFAEVESGVLEVKCRSRRCGAVRNDTVVIHRFDVHTGEALETRVFKDPNRKRKEQGK